MRRVILFLASLVLLVYSAWQTPFSSIHPSLWVLLALAAIAGLQVAVFAEDL